MSSTTVVVPPQYDDAEQQRESATTGMWLFLATEVMFFGGMFLGYAVYRFAYPSSFALASRHLDIVLGALNTAILLTSSLTMAMAVHFAQQGKMRRVVGFLIATAVLGTGFLGIKFFEYYEKFQERLVPGRGFVFDTPTPGHAQLFFSFYFAMTGMHAVHMIIGIGLMAILIVLALRGKFSQEYYAPIDMFGLYWHFVDIVWVFLFPLLYLVDRS